MSESGPIRRETPAASAATSILVRRTIDGELDALDQLVVRLSPLLLAQARFRLGSVLLRQCEPDELVHEAWLVALPRLAGITARGGRYTPVLLGFLSTTILHLVRNLARKHVLGTAGGGQGDGDPDLVQRVPAEQSGVVTKVLRAEAASEVQRQLERLDEVDRQIVILRGVEQQSNVTVGLLLAMEPNTVSKRYHRALARLRSLMPGSVFDEFDEGDPASAR